MKRNELIEKYRPTLVIISRENPLPGGTDMGVALDMLKYEHNVHTGAIERADTYKGVPADFNWEQFGQDIKTDTPEQAE